MKKFIGILGIAILGGAVSLGGYKLLVEEPVYIQQEQTSPFEMVNAVYNPALNTANTADLNSIDFTVAAENTVHAVVHVKNTSIRTQTNPWAELFNGNGTRQYQQIGTGSGVIISPDGYIITNNHVIDGASELEVTLNNKKKYKAELIGADSKNDIALVKIDADFELPYIPFANSDNVKIGEWVLAVGNPYNLTSTVTAGIVSAKGRDLEGNNNIESFIQTDAAVNPGNSGGALVNTRGELVGINTAISSQTGAFVGYSFAVPSNIAKKVVDDILEFGEVQEAILGIGVDRNYDEEGVKIASIVTDSENSKTNGLKKGDVILKINNIKISKFSELKGQLTAKRPGESVDVTVNRNGKTVVERVILSKNIERYVSNAFQLELKDLTKEDKLKRNISKGVKIIDTQKDNDAMKNFIIVKINDKEVSDAAETAKYLDNLVRNRYRVILEVINLKGEREKYIFK